MPMTKPIVIITGASGFLGSAVCIDLALNFTVVAVDRREPSLLLKKAGPQVIWHIVDIADNQAISNIFAQTKDSFGQIDFVIHFAAYYDFDKCYRNSKHIECFQARRCQAPYLRK